VRGEILSIDSDGAGQVSGNDGLRYPFAAHDVRGFSVQVGQRVDFVDVDGRATDLFLLSAGTAPAEAGFHMRGERPEPAASPWGYFVRCMKKYVDGHGRASPAEYWWFMFFRFAIMIGLAAPGLLIGIAMGGSVETEFGVLELSLLLAGLFYIATILPNFVGLIRRLHDGGFSGWLVLLNIIPYLGMFVLFILSVLPSQLRRNEHGPIPLR
jgi:uncharacterized membrane protein YhaH (DUF805 family)